MKDLMSDGLPSGIRTRDLPNTKQGVTITRTSVLLNEKFECNEQKFRIR
jgi:hypothetical protein